MRRAALVLILFNLTLLGCGVPPTREQLTLSSRPDRCIVYIFRPALDHTGFGSTPTLSVNARPVARLARETFTFVDLPPGRHSLRLNDGESNGIWNAEVAVDLAAGNTYFIAIWNQAQRTNPGTTLPLRLPSGAMIPLTIGQTYATGSIVFEPVSESLGRAAVSELNVVQPESFGLSKP